MTIVGYGDDLTQHTLHPQNSLEWEVESFRLTTFLSPDSSATEMHSWWETVVGDEPDEENSRPREGRLQQIGMIQGNQLVLTIQPGRVDWSVVVPVPALDEPLDQKTSLGPSSEMLPAFVSVAKKWLSVSPEVVRLAFGIALIQPVDDRVSGHRQLAQYLHDVKIDSEGSSDFLYQINRPRDSTTGIASLQINRLSKWSVNLRALTVIALQPGRVSSNQAPTRFACRVELDINTAADFQGELPKDRLEEIFDELVILGQEIESKGDIS